MYHALTIIFSTYSYVLPGTKSYFNSLSIFTLHSLGYAVVYNQPQPYLFGARSAAYDSQNLSKR